MNTMHDPELEVLSDQLDAQLAAGVEDADDALEIASLAGMMARLGCDPAQLAEAEAWRTGPGAALLEEAWDLLDLEEITAAIDAVASGEPLEPAPPFGLDDPDDDDAEEAAARAALTFEERVEEAVLDLDELVAAAVWCGHTGRVKAAAADVERTIRMVPESFASLAWLGREMARLPAVARDQDVYGFWLAVADAAEWLEA